jgi:hypothetical protein
MSTYRDEIEQENADFGRGLPRVELDARWDGTFFSSFESVCDFSQHDVAASYFPTIGRNKTQGARIYPNTANEEYLDHYQVATSDRSDSTNTQQKSTTVDFLFNVQGEKAHLVPNAKVCYVAYTKIVQAATGQCGINFEKRQKLLNGMEVKDRRLKDSGIKHSKYNKIHLFLQRQLLDSTPPALIIVPLLPLSTIKDWNGTPFDAMVLPCGGNARFAARGVLQNVRHCCDENEISNGIEVLHHFVKDIAESLIHDDPDVLDDVDTVAGTSRDPSLVRWISLVKELRRSSRPSIQVPVLKNALKWESLKVAKGTFDLKSCLPDPFLLAVKGAINFSSLVGTKLMPACPLDDSDSDLDDSEA